MLDNMCTEYINVGIDDIYIYIAVRILMLHQLVYQLTPFPLQVHECPSQVTSAHNLTDQALKIFLSAVSVVDFVHVRPRKEAVPHCWMVTLC